MSFTTTAAGTSARVRRLERFSTAWRVAALGVMVVLASLALPMRPASADVTFNQRMLELVNRDRAANGLPGLVADPSLGAVAEDAPYAGCGFTVYGRAKDMGTRNYFSHQILGCALQGVTNILTGKGISFSGSGENVAWMNGTTDPLVAASNLHSQLMSSTGHRNNILNPQYTRIGVGSWRTSPGQTWSGGGYALPNVFIAVQIFAGGAAASPSPSVSPTSVDFGSQVVGAQDDVQTVTLNNSGNAPLGIASTSLGGANAGDFSIANKGCGASLAAGGSCSIGVSFKPTAAGDRSASLNITDNAGGNPTTVTLRGTGTTPPLPGTPTQVKATGGDGQVSVTWTLPASGAPAIGYGVFVYDAGGYTWKSMWVCASCTSAVISGLTNGKDYYALVQGYDGTVWGAGGASNWTPVFAELRAPANVRSAAGDGAFTVTWDLPASGTGIDGYGVFAFDASGYTGKSVWACATCGTATLSGLTNGQPYYALIYPHDSRGWGPVAIGEALVPGTVSVPGNVVAVKGNGSVSVSWMASTGGAAPLAGYGLFVYEGDEYTGKSLWVCGTCTTGQIPGLTNGRQYTVRVHGYNAYGWGVPGVSKPFVPSV